MAFPCFLFLVVLLFQHGSAEVYNCLSSEQDALLAFKASIANFSRVLNWTDSGNCCQYQGVTCAPVNSSAVVSAESDGISHGASLGQVVNLSLPNLQLQAQIPSMLANLTYLQGLNLSGNTFHGNIPPSLASLTHLRVLDLSNNNLSGTITVLESLWSLKVINISSNHLSGSLPVFKNFSNLEEFYASKNNFSGTFPTDICQHASNITILDVLSNDLSGVLGSGLGLCTHLQEIYLSKNKLTGPVPEDIYNISSLSILWLHKNMFIGGLSQGVGNLLKLSELLIGNNNFSGVLPKSLSKNTQLATLVLNSNNFSGSIDVDFSNMTYLEVLDLNTNGFGGSIPLTLAKCTRLRVLILSKNNFVGSIPPSFKSLKNLTTLSMSTNKLAGGLLSLQNCENLVSLVLTKNYFTDPLPMAVDGLRTVQILALGFLNLRGQFPPWLQNCTKLQVLDLSWNHFEGAIPRWIGSFQYLTYLELSNNSFIGNIPAELFNLISMVNNVTNTTGLQPVQNFLNVKREADSPDLTYNQALPCSLYLSNNKLTGVVPVEIGRLRALVAIDLSHNLLTGTIPMSFANITDLESLDLSSNELKGPIPSSFNQLTFLASFNVSYNHLSGTIPTGNQFSTFTNASYLGNSGLCGFPLAPCTSNSTSNSFQTSESSARKATRTRTVLVSISVGVGVVLVVLAVLCYLFSGRTAVHQGVESSREMNPPESLSGAFDVLVELFHNHHKLTVGDLLKATNSFDSANIVGCGGFGLVYRADLADGSRLAIKKLTGDCGQMDREFRAEVEALSKAQHENLVSLQGYLHFGNNKLLIYSYMENGSLDYWLHERSDGPAHLDWPMRLKIAQGAAAGLAYLHQICDPHIVHRDIKSSNILLDEAFEAHLADFGLARLMMSTDTHVTTELVGTPGYIPPEYGDALNATPRGDIYSFGVVLLELLTGKRPVDVCKPRGCGDLVTWVQQMRFDSRLDQIFGHLLKGKTYEEQMQQVLDVACLCINRNPMNRPSIKNIVVWLNEIGQEGSVIK